MAMTERPMWRTALDAVLPSFKVVYRLARDSRVPTRTRVFAAGALAYALVPVDLIPDRIPVLGKLDDAALVGVALVRLVRDAGPEVVREHWDGDDDTLDAFLGAVDTLESLIPKRVLRLVDMFERRGDEA
jgi:uncharacterized membrane protein YkvA (DUF1232 family)